MKIQIKSRVQGLFLLFSLGLIWGSGYSLAHYATTHGIHPLSYAFWQSLGPAIFMFLYLAYQRPQSAKHILTPTHIRFYAVCGFLGIALPNTNMYFASAHLPAGLLAVLVNTVPVITFLVAWSVGEEHFSIARFTGVLLSVVGIMILVFPKSQLAHIQSVPWILTALISPLSFAACAVFIAKKSPPNTNPSTLSTGMLIFSTLFLIPVIMASHHFYFFEYPFALRDWVILIEIVLSSIGYVLLFMLIKLAGSVYYSLVAGVVALTGLFWGWLLFGEHLQLYSTVATLFIISGIVFVALRQRK